MRGGSGEAIPSVVNAVCKLRVGLSGGEGKQEVKMRNYVYVCVLVF